VKISPVCTCSLNLGLGSLLIHSHHQPSRRCCSHVAAAPSPFTIQLPFAPVYPLSALVRTIGPSRRQPSAAHCLRRQRCARPPPVVCALACALAWAPQGQASEGSLASGLARCMTSGLCNLLKPARIPLHLLKSDGHCARLLDTEPQCSMPCRSKIPAECGSSPSGPGSPRLSAVAPVTPDLAHHVVTPTRSS
jgi:hypothetical protein